MITALLLIAAQASAVPVAPDPRIAARVDRVLRKTPVIDGHNDLAWEIRDVHGARVESLDLAKDTRPLQTDIPRLRKGRVGAQFWSVWIPADTTGPRAVEMTLEQIDIVRRFVAANPAALERATSAADIRRIEKAGRIASLIGVEGGHQIDGRLSVLRQYRALGRRRDEPDRHDRRCQPRLRRDDARSPRRRQGTGDGLAFQRPRADRRTARHS